MWHMGDGWGWWMLFGTLMMIGFWGVVIWAVAEMVRGPRSGVERSSRQEPTALEILERRYASGELSDKAFDSRRRMLLGSERSSPDPESRRGGTGTAPPQDISGHPGATGRARPGADDPNGP